jgi:hypothetical protein
MRRLRRDRVERLLRSCEDYYHAGDHDIAILLLREAESNLRRKLGERDTEPGPEVEEPVWSPPPSGS